MAPNEFVDLFLGLCMDILELVHSLELYNVETVREDTIGFALE